MATITVTASGTYKWTDTGVNTPWPSGAPPAGGSGGDDVVLNNSGLVLQIDGTGCACKSLLVTAGTLSPDLNQHNTISVYNAINTASSSSAKVLMDVSSVPQYNTKLLTNGASGNNNNGILLNGDYDFIGAAKTEFTYTDAALVGGTSLTCDVEDATGWLVADILVFCTTQAYAATPKTDKVTIATITAIGGGAYSGSGPATVTWTDGAGTTPVAGSVLNNHDANCLVGNFTRNLIVGPVSLSNADSAFIEVSTSTRATAALIKHVMFDRCRMGSSVGGVLAFASFAAASSTAEVSSNTFYEWQGTASAYTNGIMGLVNNQLTRIKNAYYSATALTIAINYSALSGRNIGKEFSPVIFRAATGISIGIPGDAIIDPKISGCTTGFGALGINPEYWMIGTGEYGGGGIWSCDSAVALSQTNSAPVRLDSIRLGLGPHATDANYPNANNTYLLKPGSGNYSVEFYNCEDNITGGAIFAAAYGLQTSKLKMFTRNNDADLQQIYSSTSTTVPTRNKSVVAAEKTRSTSSLVFTWKTTNSDIWSESFDVPVRGGVDSRILIYIAKSTTDSPETGDVAYGAIAPYAELSGLGITPVRVTLDTDSVAGYDSGIFELAAIDLTAANAPSGGGILKLTLVGQSAVDGAQCYFSGILAAPFITGEVRHFGYIYNGQVTRDRDNTITISAADLTLPTPTELVSSETTAAAIGGATITWGASSSIAMTASRTFQQLVDYVAAKACVNVTSALPITWAGVVGSPSIFAAGNITIPDTYVLNGSGSISMSIYTLSTELASGYNYTYTGGTFSQLTTVPSFSGGTLTLGAEAALIFSATSLTIELTPSTAGVTYDLTGGTFSGTIYLKNLTAHAINVSKEADPTFDTSLNVGGTITLIAPTLNQSVSLTGLSTTCRVQLYDSSVAAPVGSRILYNAEPGATSYTWTDPAIAVASRAIRLRITDYLGATAKVMIERNIGTCGITSGDASISFANEFEEDTNYNAQAAALGYNGVDITDIEIDDSTDTVKFNFTAGGDYDARRIYMYMVYWLDTETGINDDFVFCSPLDPVNLPMTGVVFENVTSPQEIITFINAYVYDSVTGRAKDLIVGDGINFAPDHVVQVIATVGGVNIITGDEQNILDAIAAIPADVNSDPSTLTVSKLLALQQEQE